MNFNLKATSRIKYGTSFLFLLIFSYLSTAQNRQSLDIRRVTVTNRFIIKDGKNAGEAWPVYQEIFDSLGRRHSEIEFKFLSSYPYKYRWHTFKGQSIVKSEIFENEKLLMIKEFIHNSDHLVQQETIKMVKPADTSIYVIINYQYDKQKKLVLIEAKTKQGTRAYRSKSTFDSKGTEISRAVDVKTGYFPLDSIIKLKSNPIYDSIGRLKSNLVSTTKAGNKTTIYNYIYQYDNRNNVVAITILNNQGSQISREQRIYEESRNRIAQYKYFDSNDKLAVWLGLRYEIYRTKGRRVRELDY